MRVHNAQIFSHYSDNSRKHVGCYEYRLNINRYQASNFWICEENRHVSYTVTTMQEKPPQQACQCSTLHPPQLKRNPLGTGSQTNHVQTSLQITKHYGTWEIEMQTKKNP